MKMGKKYFVNKIDFIGPYNYNISFEVGLIKIDLSEQQLLKWLNIHI